MTRRTRTLRPSSRKTLTLVAVLIGFIVWVCWEVGRFPWWRTVVAVGSGLVLIVFALGWAAK